MDICCRLRKLNCTFHYISLYFFCFLMLYYQCRFISVSVLWVCYLSVQLWRRWHGVAQTQDAGPGRPRVQHEEESPRGRAVAPTQEVAVQTINYHIRIHSSRHHHILIRQTLKQLPDVPTLSCFTNSILVLTLVINMIRESRAEFASGFRHIFSKQFVLLSSSFEGGLSLRNTRIITIAINW